MVGAQGETNITNDLATYSGALKTIASQFRGVSGRSTSTSFFGNTSLAPNTYTGNSPSTDSMRIIMNQIGVGAYSSPDASIIIIGDEWDNRTPCDAACPTTVSGNYHWSSTASLDPNRSPNDYTRMGNRWARATAAYAGIAAALGGGQGPKVTAATITDTTHIRLTYTHNGVGTALRGSDGGTAGTNLTLTNAVGEPYFLVCDGGTGGISCPGGTIKAVSATAFVQPNALDIPVRGFAAQCVREAPAGARWWLRVVDQPRGLGDLVLGPVTHADESPVPGGGAHAACLR